MKMSVHATKNENIENCLHVCLLAGLVYLASCVILFLVLCILLLIQISVVATTNNKMILIIKINRRKNTVHD